MAFGLSEKRLDRQEARLEELRARTGVLLAASSVAISFLGRELFDQPGRALLIAVAVSAFVVSTTASVYVVLPRAALVSALDGSTVYERLHTEATDIEEVHRRLSYEVDAFCDKNDRQIKRLIRGFTVSASAVAVELVALVALLARTIT